MEIFVITLGFIGLFFNFLVAAIIFGAILWFLFEFFGVILKALGYGLLAFLYLFGVLFAIGSVIYFI